ncbi:MAG: hypothetical protein A2X64_09970 [Ignavibacteria bacterium GWF2_33_9]|nr:MAG: hypothetical protein A2X64_09970 [Ignavibacteria bacterium GWF2_33_9]
MKNILLYNKYLLYFKILLIVLLFSACDDSDKYMKLYDESQQIKSTNMITYPLKNSVFPADIIAPKIKWKNSQDLNWVIHLGIKGEEYSINYFTEKSSLIIPKNDWNFLKTNYIDKLLYLTVIGINKEDDKVICKDEVQFTISSDSVIAPIFYRTVTLPFSYAVDHLETISWRLGYVSDENPPQTVLQNMPVCGNCHSFSADGTQFGMDVDYGNDKGSFATSQIEDEIVISKDKIFTWSDYKREDGEQTFGLLSSISPNGKYIISTLKDRSVFVKIDDIEYSQLFFPIKGILVYYDIKKKIFKALKGADNKSFVQSNPSWYPDGKKVVFARARYYKLPEIEKSKKAILPVELAADFVSKKIMYKYDLCTVDFNEGNGGNVNLLHGASQNEMSNYFPKVSPDGKWIVFNQAESFMLLMPDSKLFIMPVSGGTPRLMNCNLSNMNSWHSWSPNGKWLVFASKHNGPYTQLWITHIDENGNDSPPVLLDNFSFSNLACNIPEFVNLKNNKRFKIKQKFLSTDFYGLQLGKNKIVQGDFSNAVKDLTEAIKTDPENYDIFNMRAIAYSELNKYDAALADFSKCIELRPNNESYFNRGNARFAVRMFKEAIDDFNEALKYNKKDVKTLYKRAAAYYNIEDFYNSLIDFDELIRVESDNYNAYYERAITKLQLGRISDACKDLQYANDHGISKAKELIDKFCNK